MHTITNTVADVVDVVKTVQDHIVRRYFQPYSVTFVYLAFSFVFLYLGLQKVVPHRSTADVQLATIAGLLGLPYIPFVTFIGLWQIAIGALFLFRRLRLCAWFFFSYQIFTFGTLVVLRKIVFQPPWINIFGFEIPWALGSYAAFIMKNLVFAAIFFVLASYEFDTGDVSSDGGEPTESRASSGASTAHVWFANSFLSFATTEERRQIFSGLPLLGHMTRLIEWAHAGQNYLVTNYFRPYGITILYWSYAFVWFYFGFQKPAPVYSPVRNPLGDFFPHFAIPVAAGMAFIGLYEMFLGILLFFKEIRVAFWFFFAHQTVTFLTLLVIPFVAFQPPWISLFGVSFPWAVTGFGAFVVKNVVFVAGFVLLVSIEIGTLDIGRNTETTDAAGE